MSIEQLCLVRKCSKYATKFSNKAEYFLLISLISEINFKVQRKKGINSP